MHRNVSIVALFNSKAEVFLVRTVKYPDCWQPVGGGIEPEDASPEAAAVREVGEEIGLKLDISSIFKVMTLPMDFGEGDVNCFIAEAPDDAHFEIKREEIAESGWFALKDAVKLPAYLATATFLKKLFNVLKKAKAAEAKVSGSAKARLSDDRGRFHGRSPS